MPTALDNGQRSPRKLLRAVVARLETIESVTPGVDWSVSVRHCRVGAGGVELLERGQSRKGAIGGSRRKLKNIVTYVRKQWRSTDPDSYDHYKRGRERTRKQAEHTHEAAERQGEQERENAERGREYVERYKAERAAAEKEEE